MGNIRITHTSRTDSHRMFKLGGGVEYATCPGPPPKGAQQPSPSFWPMSIVDKQSTISDAEHLYTNGRPKSDIRLTCQHVEYTAMCC